MTRPMQLERSTPAPGPVLQEGLLAGVLGYGAVVVVIGLLDLVTGRGLFHTPAAVGDLLFPMAAGGGEAPGDPSGPLLAFNGVHLVGSLAVGLVAAVMMLGAERLAGFWYPALMALVATGTFAVALFTGAVGEGGRVAGGGPVVDWPTIVVGTAAWLGAISAYLWWRHPALVGRMRAETEAI